MRFSITEQDVTVVSAHGLHEDINEQESSAEDNAVLRLRLGSESAPCFRVREPHIAPRRPSRRVGLSLPLRRQAHLR